MLTNSLSDKKSLILFSLSAIYIIVATIAMINDFLLIFLLPLVITIIIIALTSIDKIFLLIALLVPVSINLSKTYLGIGVSLPAEPIIFGTMVLYLINISYQGGFDKKILFHPVSIAILFHLFWMIVTSISSTLFLVSLKHTIARISFVIVFFYLGTQVFRDIKNIYKFSWAYILMFVVVIGYTLINHAMGGFTEKIAHIAMVPFYNDHTAYAAVAAMFVPLLIGFTSITDMKKWVRWASLFFLLIYIVSLVFSYTRASWVSLIAAFFCYLIFLFRIKTWIVVSGIIIFVFSLSYFQSGITMALERNEEQSSTEYASHVQSASNITTDASNVERLNRWSSALRMFKEKPIFGWGPGTYMFQYAPFQKIDEKTIISTNMGEGGNAHSEYIGPLAEQGFMGSLAFILIGILTILHTSRFIKNCDNNNIKILAKSLIIGLITYWVHGMLNNFLDTDKASLPFWGFIAALISLEVYHQKNNGSKNKELKSSIKPAT